MQLELLTARPNPIGSHLFPFIVVVLFSDSIMTLVGILRLDGNLFHCIPLSLVNLALLARFFAAFTGFLWLRAAEKMTSESVCTQKFCRIKFGSNVSSSRQWDDDDGRSIQLMLKYKRKIFNRKPAAVIIWLFAPIIESGLALSFLKAILDFVVAELQMIINSCQ